MNCTIFEEHRIEREHPDLHIPDEAFERVFTFLDDFDWHLDDRPIAKGNEINPEILGYVFEKYTNQKEMGAYYTKEDITDYIAKELHHPLSARCRGRQARRRLMESPARRSRTATSTPPSATASSAIIRPARDSTRLVAAARLH